VSGERQRLEAELAPWLFDYELAHLHDLLDLLDRLEAVAEAARPFAIKSDKMRLPGAATARDRLASAFALLDGDAA
jgi:hypothetical protein